MRLAKVLGTVVCTRKDESIEGRKLLLVQPVDQNQKPDGNPLVAIDSVDAGVGELVLIVQGSSARMTEMTKNRPADCTIMGVVDTIAEDGKTVFKKFATD